MLLLYRKRKRARPRQRVRGRMKKIVYILFLILIICIFACACEDIYEIPVNHTVSVNACGEKICSVEAYESNLNRFKLNESEEKKMIESFMSSPYYIGRFTVGYAPDEIFRYGEGESGYRFDFGDMNVGYVVKDGDSYVAYSHSAMFGYISENEEESTIIGTKSFLTGETYSGETLLGRSDMFLSGWSYPVGYGWEELKEIFANYDIDESKLTIGAQLVEYVFGNEAYLTLSYDEDTKSIGVDVRILSYTSPE